MNSSNGSTRAAGESTAWHAGVLPNEPCFSPSLESRLECPSPNAIEPHTKVAQTVSLRRSLPVRLDSTSASKSPEAAISAAINVTNFSSCLELCNGGQNETNENHK